MDAPSAGPPAVPATPPVGAWADGPRGLAPACYVSEAFYALEVERIFRKDWLCVGRADEIPEPGDYMSLDLLGEPLVVVRGGDRLVRVMSRVCRHRGMPVVAGSGRARTLVCPYHAWTYGLDGRLLGAPEMERTPCFDPATCRLPGLRTEIWEGFVFVSFDAEAVPLAPTLAGLAPVVRNHGLASLQTVRSIPFDMDCGWNWKLMCENFMEPYHHIGTHRKSLEPTVPARLAVTPDSDGPFSVVHMRYRAADGAVAGDGWGVPSLPPNERLTDEERGRVTLVHVYPLGLITLFVDHAEFYRTLPEGPGRVRLEKLICVSPAARSAPGFEAGIEQIVQGFLPIRDEDVAICRGVQAGLASRLAEPGRLCHLEKPIWEFARWVDARVRGAGTLSS
jgi:phenylpropionate dioxygenase-like ring-hydroxylating dioxygenase large terminal subunit